MKKFFAQIFLLFLCCNFAFAESGVTAFSVLKKNYPAVNWNLKSQIKGNFDYDGVTDYALRGRKGKKFVVGIVKGLVTEKSKHWTLEFGEDAGDQGGLCSVKSAVIAIDDIDKNYVRFAVDYLKPDFAKRLQSVPKNSKGITISDRMCDSFQIFRDKKIKQFIWWQI